MISVSVGPIQIATNVVVGFARMMLNTKSNYIGTLQLQGFYSQLFS